MNNLIKTIPIWCCFLLTSCIKNTIPYPVKEALITAFEVEGQCAAEEGGSVQATIDKSKYTIKLYVDDSVELSNLQITKMTVSNDATIVAPDACVDAAAFPTLGFESAAALSSSANTRVDFSNPVTFTLQTYQDYEWTITVEQIINREVMLENQVGDAVIDEVNHNVVVYVATEQPLDKIKVTSMNLGGKHGTVVPDLTVFAAYDFSMPVQLEVTNGWDGETAIWTVFVYHSQGTTSTATNLFARCTNATLNGKTQNGRIPTIEYKMAAESDWITLAESAITVSGTSYKTTLENLIPGTNYQYRVNGGEIQAFTTAPATPLTDASFDNWHQVERLWNPWAQSATSFWDTGNRGATTVGNSNSVPTDDTCNGSGQAALLESKYIVIKFAAGNIFTGTYVKTDGTNGILDFGREFSSFPTKLRVNYKCEVATINRCGDDDYEWLKGRQDTCHIYIALTDWDEPLQIRTRPSERQLFDKNSSRIIAYGELLKGESVSEWTQVDIPLEYRYNNRTPKYILVVASSSKYGDFFTGGEGSKLWIDNFELLYE
ncbi:MAG: PCMD domain-containing protein [Bacteroides sp.]|nr:PCMD domain-containing protein [Bacteroides sp.]